MVFVFLNGSKNRKLDLGDAKFVEKSIGTVK